jgi:hypothetical protein
VNATDGEKTRWAAKTGHCDARGSKDEKLFQLFLLTTLKFRRALP